MWDAFEAAWGRRLGDASRQLLLLVQFSAVLGAEQSAFESAHNNGEKLEEGSLNDILLSIQSLIGRTLHTAFEKVHTMEKSWTQNSFIS